jgi:hypothetical protein
MQSNLTQGDTQYCNSVFRTKAWVQAWIDTWENDSRIQLIDLGGGKNPLEYFYITRHRLKKIIPVKTLCLAGIGCASISSPRAEYNDFSALLSLTGGIKEFYAAISGLAWQQFYVSDVLQSSEAEQNIYSLAQQPELMLHTQNLEPAYAVQAQNFDDYLAQLGSNTRLAYFNRRKNLARQGEVHFQSYDIETADKAFALLNYFHCQRWGRPCYSLDSQQLMKNFCERLTAQGGSYILQSMHVNGEAVSIIFDVIWQSTRYNFQSGYEENKYPKIALGALHMGYAIEQAIVNQQTYDFMAGTGKNSDYKKRIATRTQLIASHTIERSYLKTLRSTQGYLNRRPT